MNINPIQGVAQSPAVSGGDAQHVTRQEVQDVTKRVAAPGSPPEHKKEAAQEEQRLKQATQHLNDFMQHFSFGLKFEIDERQVIVKVLNKESGEVIRQIPSEEAIRISKALDTLKGLIIQQKA